MAGESSASSGGVMKKALHHHSQSSEARLLKINGRRLGKGYTYISSSQCVNLTILRF